MSTSVMTDDIALTDVSISEDSKSPEPAKKKSQLLVILLCLFAAMGGFVFGYDTGTISGFINMDSFLQSFGEPDESGVFFLSRMRAGLIVGLFSIGAFLGTLLGGFLADKVGRKKGIVYVAMIYIVGMLIQITAFTAWYQVAVGRVVGGLGIGALSVLVPMFQSETAPQNLRGALVSSFQLFITLGIFVGFSVCYATKSRLDTGAYRIPMGLCFAWAFILLIGMCFMPESPRFLVSIGRIEEARKAMATTNQVPLDDPVVDEELKAIENAVIREQSAGKATWTELFTGEPRMGYRLTLGILVQVLQQLCGANYFFYYGTSIFKAIGMSDSFATSMIFGGINFLSTFGGLYIVDRFGRRKCLLGGAMVMFVCFLVYSTVGFAALYPNGDTTQPASKIVGDVMILFTCIFIAAFASTWAPIAFVVVSETFPLRMRSKGMAVATGGNWMINFFVSFLTPFITSSIGFKYGYVFTACLGFAIVFVFFFIPETKGLSLEDVDELYASGVSARKSPDWIPSSKIQDANEPKNSMADFSESS
ncbi:Low-affinity glucose transporter [Yarrowia sp. C11]|nr:Low-affinity glucose transporter [Yarrowia sp. C11]KAG5364124.1 Low-affinity glucose transporter [Yarrowia sp. E02]